MPQPHLIKLACSKCKRINYWSSKNKKNKKGIDRKIELKKYCRWCKAHTVHKQAKK
ncbi:MAG TPA: 50S ribosomal protein L33 [Candidatus Paceibacterota bacterium]